MRCGSDVSTYITHEKCVYVCVLYTGWRRLIGSPKLQIIFHKRATKYRSLLQKMTGKDKGSYESSPPFSKRATEYRSLLQKMTSKDKGSYESSPPVSKRATEYRSLLQKMTGKDKGCYESSPPVSKRATKYRSLLQKMTGKDKGCYESSPPVSKRRPLYFVKGVYVYTTGGVLTYITHAYNVCLHISHEVRLRA